MFLIERKLYTLSASKDGRKLQKNHRETKDFIHKIGRLTRKLNKVHRGARDFNWAWTYRLSILLAQPTFTCSNSALWKVEHQNNVCNLFKVNRMTGNRTRRQRNDVSDFIGVFVVDFKHIFHTVLDFAMLTMNM